LATNNFSKENSKKLANFIDDVNTNQKTAFIRLIIEHARINDELPQNPDTLPYKGTVIKGSEDISNGDVVEFEIKNFPKDLKWILLKFFEMCNGNTL